MTYDDDNNKMVLYNAQYLQDFNAKLRIKRLKEFLKIKSFLQKKQSAPSTVNKPCKTRCYNYDLIGHKSVNCPSKANGTKCFKCNEYSQRSFECSNKKGSKNAEDIRLKQMLAGEFEINFDIFL